MRPDYDEYMKSMAWFRRRDAYFREYRYECHCGEKRAIELHHKTYERLGAERDEDFVPLCGDCHKHVHEQATLIFRSGKVSMAEAIAKATGYRFAKKRPSEKKPPPPISVGSWEECASHPKQGPCGYCDAVEGITGRRPTPWTPLPSPTWTDEEVPDLAPIGVRIVERK